MKLTDRAANAATLSLVFATALWLPVAALRPTMTVADGVLSFLSIFWGVAAYLVFGIKVTADVKSFAQVCLGTICIYCGVDAFFKIFGSSI